MSGYSREEWEGKKSWTEFVIPDDRERMKIYHQLRRVNRNDPPCNMNSALLTVRNASVMSS